MLAGTSLVVCTLVGAVQVVLTLRAVDRVRTTLCDSWGAPHDDPDEVQRRLIAACESEGLIYSGITFRVVQGQYWKRASVEVRKTVRILWLIPVEMRFELMDDAPIF